MFYFIINLSVHCGSSKCLYALPAPLKIKLNRPIQEVLSMGRRKTQKIIRTGPKNATTGMCPVCKTIGKIFILGSPGEERAKCEKCRQEFEL